MKLKLFGYDLTVSLQRVPTDWVSLLIKSAIVAAEEKDYDIYGNNKNLSTFIQRIKAVREVKNPFPLDLKERFYCRDDGSPSLTSAKLFVEKYWMP